MPEPHERHAHAQVDPAFRPFVEYLRAELSSEYQIVEQVENKRRTQALVIEHPAGVLIHWIGLREGDDIFPPPETPADRAVFLRFLNLRRHYDAAD
jgi:hypothetical protein